MSRDGGEARAGEEHMSGMAAQSLPQQALGRDGSRVSRIALGCMGLSGTWNPAEPAGALNDLLRRGLIRSVGVSNYYPEQVRALQRYLDAPLRSNQIEISLMRLEPLYEGLDGGDGTLDQCMALGMTPLAWSPLGGGGLVGRGRRGGDADRA